MRVPVVLLVAILTAGCSTASSAPFTEEAQCRQQGGVWRAAASYCDNSGSGGGGY